MASWAEKRPTNSDRSAEEFSVCTHCNRLSDNLTNCDRCGAALPRAQDNSSSVCYNPKRPRPDSAQPSEQTTNGNGVATDTANTETSNSAMTSQPVPQTLFVNSHSSAPTDGGDVRPQALFMNLNNVAVRVTAPAPAPTAQPAIQSSMQSRGPVMATQNQFMPPNASVSLTSQLPAAINHNPHGNGIPQQPPPYTTTLQMANPAPVKDVVLLKVHQIRIGTRKFFPQGEVEVKDEGVLLTLANYNQAPVLLNARAINGAKMCLSEYPVLFLFLENSCIKQIKNIFKINTDEFQEGGSVMNVQQMKRCITIFPSLNNPRLADVINIFRSMEDKFYQSRRICSVITADEAIDMLLSGHVGSSASTTSSSVTVVAPNHSSAQAQTHLSSALGGQAVLSNNMTGQSLLSANRPTLSSALMRNPMQGSMTMTNNNALLNMFTATNANALPQAAATQVVNSHSNMRMTIAASQPGSNMTLGAAGRLSALASNVPAAPASNTSSGGSNTLSFNTGANPPTLKIPHDPNKWAQLQRKLVVGGVYQVLTPDGTKKYCLWNGEKLMPCLVQNTEVQLSIQCIRVGSMLATRVNMVHIKGEMGGGISFKLKFNNQIMEVRLHLNDIQNIAVCFEHLPALFIHATASGAEIVRQQCKMFDPYKNPYYSLNSREVNQRHIVLLLKDINSDQKEALLQMKKPSSGGPMKMINELNYLTALKIIASIKENSSMADKILEFISRASGSGGPVTSKTPTLESIAREIQESEMPGTLIETVDDDDDDVIMTSEEIGVKCPYTQKVMVFPVRNRICGHNYEKAAIVEFITDRSRRKTVAKCPYAGCGNQTPLNIADLDDNSELKEYIRQNPAPS